MAVRLINFLILATAASLFTGCAGDDPDKIIRVSRQNNSGTYAYFRETVVGKEREFKLGSIDQSGSKDVVELVSTTPAAIGYSGMGYKTPEVKFLAVSKDGGEPVAPTVATAKDGTYPIARGLYIYTLGEPEGAVKAFLDWIMSAEGQDIVSQIGYVPVEPKEGPVTEPGTEEVSINIKGSDTMVNLAQAWAETYSKKHSNVRPEVSGGGSGTGIAALIDGTVQMANASREMKPKEKEKAEANSGKKVMEYTVALDALAVYAHKDNPLDSISMEDLAEIYGEGGKITNWTQVKGWPK